MEAARLWPTMDDELGYPTEYEPGTINVALHEDSLEFQKEMVPELQQMGVDAKVLDPDTIKEMAPLISPRILGGLFNPMGGHANPQRSVQAYAWAAQDHGARILQHVTVTGFKVQGESVTAVETSEGDIETNFVVSAAGAQTTALAEMVGAFRSNVAVPSRDRGHRAGGADVVGRRQRKRPVRPPDQARQSGLRRRPARVDRHR